MIGIVMRFRIDYFLRGKERWWCCEASTDTLSLDDALLALITLHMSYEDQVLRVDLPRTSTLDHIQLAKELGISDVRVSPSITKNPDL